MYQNYRGSSLPQQTGLGTVQHIAAGCNMQTETIHTEKHTKVVGVV